MPFIFKPQVVYDLYSCIQVVDSVERRCKQSYLKKQHFQFNLKKLTKLRFKCEICYR